MRIYVEDWDASYGSPYLVGSDDVAPEGGAEVVEDAVVRAHRPERSETLPRVAFVDGVRRVEGRLYLEDGDGALVRGIAGAHALGAAVAEDGVRCRFERCEVVRLVIWSHGCRAELPDVPGGWAWRARAVASPDPEAPAIELQRRMREAEGRLAERLCADDWLTVVDGPLDFVPSRDIPVIGLVKTHHRQLLPSEDHARVPELDAGERTSLFRLRTDLFAAYLRLARPARHAGPWSGIVRLDLPASVGVADAAWVADRAAATLPRFAGVAHTDPRAPQNLQPIGALERHLRHRLGDAGLASRAVRDAVGALRDAEPARASRTLEETA